MVIPSVRQEYSSLTITFVRNKTRPNEQSNIPSFILIYHSTNEVNRIIDTHKRERKMMILLYPTRQILSKGEISDFRFQHFRLMSGINDTITPQPRFVRKREREGGWGERVSGRKRARKRESGR